MLDPFKLLFSDVTEKDICLSCPDHRLFVLIEELHALYRAVRSLVELSGKGLNAENMPVRGNIDCFSVKNIHGRL